MLIPRPQGFQLDRIPNNITLVLDYQVLLDE